MFRALSSAASVRNGEILRATNTSNSTAADCYYLLTSLPPSLSLSPKSTSLHLSQYLLQTRQQELSVGTMICGFESGSPKIYYCDNSGLRSRCLYNAVGSGGNVALGVLDDFIAEKPSTNPNTACECSIEEGISAVRRAVVEATKKVRKKRAREATRPGIRLMLLNRNLCRREERSDDET